MLYKGNHKKGEIEILKEVSVYKNKYGEFFNDKVKFPSGYEGTFFRFSGVKKGVVIIPILKNENIAMQKNFRHGVRKWILELPKGGVPKGHSYKEAAQMELEEEMSLISNDLEVIGYTYESPGLIETKVKIIIAKNCQFKKNSKEQELTECLGKMEEFSIKEIKKLILNNKIEFSMDEAAFLKYFLINNI